MSCCLIFNFSQAALLVNDKIIYSPDRDANDWGYQIKIQNDKMLVSNYAMIDGFGRAGSVDYYQNSDGEGWVFKQRIEPPMDLSFETGLLSFGKTALDNERLLIGATWADVGNPLGGGDFQQDAGKVFLYTYNMITNKWDFDVGFQASDAAKVDAYARPVFADAHVIIGASLKDIEDLDNAGAVYIYSQNSGEDWQEIQKLESTALASSSYFGRHIYRCENEFFVSASNVLNDPSSDGVKRSGVYIYEQGEDDFWSQKKLLLSDTEYSGDNFGRKLLCDSNRLIISAFQEDTDQTDDEDNQNGAVHFYFKNSEGNWEFQQKIVGVRSFENSRRNKANRFGQGMAWEGDILLISENISYGNRGEGVIHQYVYDTENKLWNIVQSLTSIEPAKFSSAY
jgi:phage pi2 protein 07